MTALNEAVLRRLVDNEPIKEDDHDPASRSYTCAKCTNTFHVDFEHEPSPVCDGCAQDLVVQYAQEIDRMRKREADEAAARIFSAPTQRNVRFRGGRR